MADYSDLIPANLRASVSDGTRLKKSITTDLYSGGTPGAADQVKRSIMYADGTLKESIANAAGLKPSWLVYGAAAPSTDFILTFTTTTPSESITLPTVSGGNVYNATVDWGDNSTSEITIYTDPDRIHTYADAGTYTVSISGTWENMSFFNVPASKLKVNSVVNWGSVGLKTVDFLSCSNFTSIPDGSMPSTLLVASYCFEGTGLTTCPDDLLLDCVNLTKVNRLFKGRGITSVGNAGNWPIALWTDATSMFEGCTINTTDYNALLVGWEAQTEPTGIAFHGGSSTHSGAGTTARGVLTGTSTWTITDGGAA